MSSGRLILALVIGGILLAAGILWGLEREVESRFRGDLFAIPSRVYSRPLVLTAGMDVERAGVDERLRRLGYRRVSSPEVGTLEFASRDGWLAFGPQDAPPAEGAGPASRVVLELYGGSRIRRIADGRGRRLESAELPPELIAEIHGPYRARRRLVPLAEVPSHLVDAVLVTEDQRFFEHSGLDLRRIAGALVANVKARRIVQGGSTITQQLVKNLYLSPDRTLRRKAREAVMALLLDRNHTKQEILEAYLNEIYLGQRGAVAIHGVGEAAAHYFGKDVRDLTLGEAALLAGMIASPGHYSPFRDVEASQSRRDLVLGLLYTHERISAEELARALHEPLAVENRASEGIDAPHFVDRVKRDLGPDFDDERLQSQGLQIHTTLDPHLQRLATRAVREGLADLERRFPRLQRDESPLEAALVALDPRSGDVLALVGGRDYQLSQFDRATQAQRQPGSVFKPVVALAALSRAEGNEPALTLASQLEDEALSVDTREGLWSPVNFDREFRGRVTLREAVEQSLNVPMVRVGLTVGPERIVSTARRLGISSRLSAVPSLALGSFEVSPLEMTRAYAVLASGGALPEIRTYSAVRDAGGNLLTETRAASSRVFGPAETYLVTSALQGVVDHGTGQGLRSLGLVGPIAGKTGTTNDFRDAWFIGYTPNLTAGVWVGFDDAAGLGLPASALALPLFARFMKAALGPNGGDPFEVPHEIELVSIHAESGKRAGPGCWGEREAFLPGTAPEEECVGRGWGLASRPFQWLRGRLRLGGPRARHPARSRERRSQERSQEVRREKQGAAGSERGPAPGWHGGVWIGDPNRAR